jgi:hypothetical protein
MQEEEKNKLAINSKIVKVIIFKKNHKIIYLRLLKKSRLRDPLAVRLNILKLSKRKLKLK